MSEIIINRAKESIGKEAKVFLKNGFRYFGKITNSDEEWLEILDYKFNSYKLIRFDNILDVEIKK